MMMDDPNSYILTIDGEKWLFTAVPGSEQWPAGDPCPQHKEKLVTFVKVDDDFVADPHSEA